MTQLFGSFFLGSRVQKFLIPLAKKKKKKYIATQNHKYLKYLSLWN